MTEKHYGGSTSYGAKTLSGKKDSSPVQLAKETKPFSEETSPELDKEAIEKLKKAGKITSEVIKFARSFIKKDLPLLEIADKIENKIVELGGRPAFPVNLSINEIAAHATPAYNSDEKAYGLLKVDLGVHIDGYTADTAFSLDLEGTEENKNLIAAAESALNEAVKAISLSEELGQIGSIINKEITRHNTIPIINLSGHSMEQYNLHAGITIPNTNNFSTFKLPPGVYAIEPFSTLKSGSGTVRDGRPSGIYHFQNAIQVRDNFAREVLDFIVDEYQTLPFCSRWIYRKFGARGLLALRQIEASGCLHHYAQLIEKSGKKVAQAEHTVILTEKEKIITTA